MRLIDADTLLIQIKYKPVPNILSETWNELYERVIEEIDNAPTVEQRPQGKWEEDWQEDLDFMSRKGWKCPFCKWRTTYGESNFCMNCGADLRKGGAK